MLGLELLEKNPGEKILHDPRLTWNTRELVKEAGGIPILAHPGLLDIVDFNAYEYFLSELVPMGLMGIEVYYPGHSVEETDFFTELAETFDLLATGGSDFHGAINPEIQIGSGTGNLDVPYVIYERLVHAINQLQQSGSNPNEPIPNEPKMKNPE